MFRVNLSKDSFFNPSPQKIKDLFQQQIYLVTFILFLELL